MQYVRKESYRRWAHHDTECYRKTTRKWWSELNHVSVRLSSTRRSISVTTKITSKISIIIRQILRMTTSMISMTRSKIFTYKRLCHLRDDNSRAVTEPNLYRRTYWDESSSQFFVNNRKYRTERTKSIDSHLNSFIALLFL